MRNIKNMLLVTASLTLLMASCGGSKPADNTAPASAGAGADADHVVASAGNDNSGYKKITAEEAKRIIDENDSYILLDVRTEQEYAESRIDGAVLIPHNDIDSRAQADLPEKDVIILVYCRSGARSAAASHVLAQIGYTNVYDIGGIIDWPYGTVK